MLSRQHHTNTPIAGLFLEAGRSAAIAEIFTSAAGTAIAAFDRFAERRRSARLHRQTIAAMSKLNDHLLADVGWPGRYEAQRHTEKPGQ